MTEQILLIWLVLIAVFIVIEIATLGLTTIWFAGGALVSFLAGLCGASSTVQIVLFFVVSIALLFCVRPSACKKFNSGRMKTNIEGIIGTEGKVLEQIDNFNQKGAVLLDGKQWTARSVDDAIIEVGEKVYVVKISGVKLIVTNKKEEV